MRDHSSIQLGKHQLAGDLYLVRGSRGLVIFVHGKGSNRHSKRNLRVAQTLQRHQLSTLLFDLLTPEEALDPDRPPGASPLADRVLDVIDALPRSWVSRASVCAARGPAPMWRCMRPRAAPVPCRPSSAAAGRWSSTPAYCAR